MPDLMATIPADPYAGLGPATLAQGGARRLPLPDASVDLIATSPPFLNLRSYTDGGAHYPGQIGTGTQAQFLDDLWAATAEMARVLKPTGSIFVELGDSYTDKSLNLTPHRYAAGCIDKLGLTLRAEIVWSRPNGLPESVTDRVRRSHSVWFHFTLQPRYFAAIDEIREEHAPQSIARTGRNRFTPDLTQNGIGSPNTLNPADACNPLGKLPGSVREIPTQPLTIPPTLGIDHFAAYPPAWPAWIIQGWTPRGVCTACGQGRRPVTDVEYLSIGDRFAGGTATAGRHRSGTRMGDGALATITGYVCGCPTPDAPTTPARVLDPFSGTGTTILAARALGRAGIGIDLSHDYTRLARWRVQDRDQLAAVRGLPRTHPTPANDQPSLLDLIGEA